MKRTFNVIEVFAGVIAGVACVGAVALTVLCLVFDLITF